jgi:hypothetical protein
MVYYRLYVKLLPITTPEIKQCVVIVGLSYCNSNTTCGTEITVIRVELQWVSVRCNNMILN